MEIFLALRFGSPSCRLVWFESLVLALFAYTFVRFWSSPWVRVQCRQIQIPKVGADRNEEIIPVNRLTQDYLPPLYAPALINKGHSLCRLSESASETESACTVRLPYFTISRFDQVGLSALRRLTSHTLALRVQAAVTHCCIYKRVFVQSTGSLGGQLWRGQLRVRDARELTTVRNISREDQKFDDKNLQSNENRCGRCNCCVSVVLNGDIFSWKLTSVPVIFQPKATIYIWSDLKRNIRILSVPECP